MNTTETVKRFANQTPNPRQGGRVDWRGNVGYGGGNGGFAGANAHFGPRIFCQGNVLYSYGTHFPLAVYLGEHKGKKVFLKNGDRWSVTTSGQQRDVQSLCYGPTVSFSALNAASTLDGPVRPEDFTLENIVDFHADTRVDLIRDPETGVFYHQGEYNSETQQRERGEVFTPPKQGAFMPWGYAGADDGAGVWHILAACLFNAGGRFLLSAIDEGSYFVSEIPVPAKKIADAFALLKPREVRKAERQGATVQRQGEWYFIGTGIDSDKGLAQALNLPKLNGQLKRDGLPRRSGQENIHLCYQVDHSGDLFARGTVRHVRVTPSGDWIQIDGTQQYVSKPRLVSTREHAALKLGAQWHRVYRNTELGSWTTSGSLGRVD